MRGTRWSGVAEAYRQSFSALCSGTVDTLIADTLGPRHLDVGCGTGLLALRAAMAGRQVTAVDVDADMLAMTQELAGAAGVSVLAGALPQLPLPSGAFDTVTANFVLNHVPDPRAAAHELARLVRVGGLVAATTWTNQPTPQAHLFSESLTAAGAVAVPGQRLPPELDFERSVEGLAGILEEAGLAPVIRRELAWDWDVSWASLWAGISGGVATIGATYLAQTHHVRRRIEDEMRARARRLEVDGRVHLPSRAAYVVARKDAASTGPCRGASRPKRAIQWPSRALCK